jgi:hypothetical protein
VLLANNHLADVSVSLQVVRFLAETAWYLNKARGEVPNQFAATDARRKALETILTFGLVSIQILVTKAVQSGAFSNTIMRITNVAHRVFYAANLRRIFCPDSAWLPDGAVLAIEAIWQQAVHDLARANTLKRKLMSVYETRHDVCTSCSKSIIYYRLRHGRSFNYFEPGPEPDYDRRMEPRCAIH